jgi:triosephosphate isomerase
LKNNLKPILCIGEVLADYEAGKTKEIVAEQFNSSLNGILRGNSVTIAYEPVWAIGTGKAATGEQANDTISFIRSSIAERYGMDTANDMRILYGGSVTASNVAEFVEQPDIDGALVGGASLKPAEFLGIVQKTARVKSRS